MCTARYTRWDRISEESEDRGSIRRSQKFQRITEVSEERKKSEAEKSIRKRETD